MHPVVWDPKDLSLLQNPYPKYAELRQNQPISHQLTDSFVFTKHADISEILKDPHSYSRRLKSLSKNGDLVNKMRYEAPRPVAKSVLNTDPPMHTRLKRFAMALLSKNLFESLSPIIDDLIEESFAEIKDLGEFDFMEVVARRIPSRVITHLFGLDNSVANDLVNWGRDIGRSLDPVGSDDLWKEREAAIYQIYLTFSELLEDRKNNPRENDFTTSLINVTKDNDKMSFVEAISMAGTLYIASFDTTSNSLGLSLNSLLDNRSEMDRWVQDPSLDKTAIDELLRYDSVIQYIARVSLNDKTFKNNSGETIEVPSGSNIICLTGSAHRDEEVFFNPNSLILDRGNASKHLSFGAGIHFCLGSILARIILKKVLTSFIRTFTNIEKTTDIVIRKTSSIRGVEELELCVR
jgi:cytochrome P450